MCSAASVSSCRCLTSAALCWCTHHLIHSRHHPGCLLPFLPAIPYPQNPDDFRLIISFVTQSVIVFPKSNIQLSAPRGVLQVRSRIGVVEQTGSIILDGFRGLVSRFVLWLASVRNSYRRSRSLSERRENWSCINPYL